MLYPMPGEISLTHNSVFFLEELPEFKRNVLEVMRQPIEDRHVTISSAISSLSYPANFTLVAAMHPIPAAVTACLKILSLTSPAAKTPGIFVSVESGFVVK